MDGLEFVDALGLVAADVLCDAVLLGEVVPVDEVPGEVVLVGEVEVLGESVLVGVTAICAAARTCDDAGTDAQIVLAVLAASVVAARTANSVNIVPDPKNPMPTIAPSAAGLRSSALTGCKPRSTYPSQHHTCRSPSPQYSCFERRFQRSWIGHQRFMIVSLWPIPPSAAGTARHRFAHALLTRSHATGMSTCMG